MLVDTEFEPDEEFTPEGLVILYLAPGMELAGGANMLIYSHQFDTLIARLKQLAPYLRASNGIDILIDEPCAGDEASYAPSQVVEFVDSCNQPWFTAVAKWETEDETLEEGRVYYLTAELRCVGHAIPEDFPITLNGVLPVEEPSYSYMDGASIIKATWSFVIGEPEIVTVSFDTGEITASPELIQIPKGSKLDRSILPPVFDIVKNEDGRWKFDGWFDANRVCHGKMSLLSRMSYSCGMVGNHEEVDLTYSIPYVGEDLGTLSVEEGAPIEIDAKEFIDSHWNEYTKAENTDPLIAYFMSTVQRVYLTVPGG